MEWPWPLLERKYTGTTLLLTGAAALAMGWAASWFFSPDVPLPPQVQDEAQSQISNSDQDNFSEPSTPRDVGVSGRRPPRRTNTSLSYDSTADARAEYKQAILIRTDVDMGTGKIAAQACHASVSAVKKAWRSKDPAYKAWEANKAIKVCLGVDSAEALMIIRDQARDAGLATAVVFDATTEPASRTVVAIGPGSSKDIDAITMHLKLYDQV